VTCEEIIRTIQYVQRLSVEQRKCQGSLVYTNLLEKYPDQPILWSHLGILEAEKRNYEKSVEYFRHALFLTQQSPEAKIDLSVSLFQKGEVDEAEDLLLDVIKEHPKRFHVAYSNLGSLLEAKGNVEEAIEVFSRALDIFPRVPILHKNLGLAYIKKGELLKGWHEMIEWARLEKPVRSYLPSKGWMGEEIEGKTLLVYTEGGFGYFFQFFRYLALLSERKCTVLIEMYDRSIMGDLIVRSLPKGINIYTGKERFDFACSISHLGCLLQTTLDAIPNKIPYLIPHPYKTIDWKRFFAKDPNYKIGIIWKGNPDQINDYHRSMSLKTFSILEGIPGCSFYGLQKGNTERCLEGICFTDLSTKLKTFDDTAAVMSCLDLVISVDTSSAHLAAALNKPTWLLLGFHSAPYWMLDKENSPWYPTMRIFRSKGANQWGELMHAVRNALIDRTKSLKI